MVVVVVFVLIGDKRLHVWCSTNLRTRMHSFIRAADGLKGPAEKV